MSTSLRNWYEDNQVRGRASRVLYGSIAVTVLLYLIPFGNLVAYPLTLFSTLVHELGHGLTALATGGEFHRLAVYANTSGVTTSSSGSGDVGQALVAGGGLVGPALLAGVGFLCAGRERGSRIFMGALALGLALALALFVRNPFGIFFTSAVVLLTGWVVVRCKASTAQMVAVFMSVQLALSVFSRGDYLFTESANTAAGIMPSDVAHMARLLGGTYWMWGIICGAFSVLVLSIGATFFIRRITPKSVSTAVM